MQKVNSYDEAVKTALSILTKRNDLSVQGRNSNIESWYAVWKGFPNWLKYKIMVNGEEIEATYLTLNIPRYITKSWANNYANEDTEITIPVKASNDRLQEVFKKNELFCNFNSFVDSMMGLGCGAILVNVDKMMENKTTHELSVSPNADVKLNYISGRRIIPITIEDGEVTECAFTSYSTNEVKIVIHYKRDDGKYSFAEVKGKNINGNASFDFDNISRFDTDSEEPLFIYWKPAVAEDDDVERGTGVSIYDGAMDTFRQCDLAYTSLWKELKLGQKQLFVSSDIDIVDANGKHANPLPASEGIISVPTGADGKTMLQEFNGELRIQQIISCLNFHLNASAMLCGLGQSTFEFDGSGGRPIQTATGVIAKQTELYRNVLKQENYANGRFRRLVQAIMYVNNEMTSKPKITLESLNDIQVKYDDNIVEDTATKKTNDLAEVNAGVKTIAEFRADWYDEGDKDAEAFCKENGLLAIKYLPLLQAGGISPQHFCELVYGDTKDLAYITEKMSPAIEPVNPYANEDDADENENENNEADNTSYTNESDDTEGVDA